MIKVFIVDDHELVRTGFKRMLGDIQGIKVVGEAKSGEEGVRKVRELNPDVVLMDVKMPGIGGLEATIKMLRYDPELKVLVVTVCDDDLFPSRLLQAGAFGYLTKGASIDEMVRAIKVVNSGQRYISLEIANQLAMKHLNDTSDSPFDQLSERELQVSLMITSGVKVQTISENLCLSPKTINSYRYRIFDKLDVSGDVELTHLAMRYGLLDDVEDTGA